MSKEDKVLADYQKQLKLEQERLSGYAEGTNVVSDTTAAGRKTATAAAIANSKQKIAKLKGMIQAHERRAKHG